MTKEERVLSINRQLAGLSVKDAVWVLTEVLRLVTYSTQHDHAEDFIQKLTDLTEKFPASEEQNEPRQ